MSRQTKHISGIIRPICLCCNSILKEIYMYDIYGYDNLSRVFKCRNEKCELYEVMVYDCLNQVKFEKRG